jgi:putative hydrolase of the HAD superfamily
MSRAEAFLVDVYETILTCSFEAHANELPLIAGVPASAWNRELARLGPALTDGRLTIAQAMEHALEACGVQPRPQVLSELVRKDAELTLSSARLFEDALPFLHLLRSNGVKVALVSNCADSTRPLLEDLGVTELVDAVLLSCEVGFAKPRPEIYEQALGRLGVSAPGAVFVDDQAWYCAGASAVGIRAVQIARDGASPVLLEGGTTVRSLLELETML